MDWIVDIALGLGCEGTAATAPRAVRKLWLALRARSGKLPSRASSAPSPRKRRRCLQVRRSIDTDWFRHAGQLQE